MLIYNRSSQKVRTSHITFYKAAGHFLKIASTLRLFEEKSVLTIFKKTGTGGSFILKF